MSSCSSRLRKGAGALAAIRSSGDPHLTLRIAGFFLRLPLVLRRDPRHLRAAIEPPAPGGEPDLLQAARSIAIIAAFMRLFSPLIRRRCMVRGAAHYHFLRAAGIDVELRFGMAKRGDGFLGHCWLTRDGEPYLEASDPREMYVEFYRIPEE